MMDTVERFEALLDDPITVNAVQKDIQLAQNLGIDSVPTLIIDSTTKISGAITTTISRE